MALWASHDSPFDSIPIIARILLFLFRFIAIPLGNLVVIDHLGSHQDARLQQTDLQLAQSKAIRFVADALEANESVGTDSVHEADDTWQDLDLEPGHKESGVLHVDADEPGIEVLWRECLKSQ